MADDVRESQQRYTDALDACRKQREQIAQDIEFSELLHLRSIRNERVTMEIQTKSASLDTFAVTIQALHVNGKQMTLAVFRQLPEVSILDERHYKDSSLKWWGKVNYRVGDSDRWMVCERDGRLYRAAFCMRSTNPVAGEADKMPQLFIAA